MAGRGGRNSKDQEYAVKAILKRRVRKGKVEYLIQWEGCSDSENSWEPVRNLQGCAELLSEFQIQEQLHSSRGPFGPLHNLDSQSEPETKDSLRPSANANANVLDRSINSLLGSRAPFGSKHAPGTDQWKQDPTTRSMSERGVINPQIEAPLLRAIGQTGRSRDFKLTGATRKNTDRHALEDGRRREQPSEEEGLRHKNDRRQLRRGRGEEEPERGTTESELRQRPYEKHVARGGGNGNRRSESRQNSTGDEDWTENSREGRRTGGKRPLRGRGEPRSGRKRAEKREARHMTQARETRHSGLQPQTESWEKKSPYDTAGHAEPIKGRQRKLPMEHVEHSRPLSSRADKRTKQQRGAGRPAQDEAKPIFNTIHAGAQPREEVHTESLPIENDKSSERTLKAGKLNLISRSLPLPSVLYESSPGLDQSMTQSLSQLSAFTGNPINGTTPGLTDNFKGQAMPSTSTVSKEERPEVATLHKENSKANPAATETKQCGPTTRSKGRSTPEGKAGSKLELKVRNNPEGKSKNDDKEQEWELKNSQSKHTEKKGKAEERKDDLGTDGKNASNENENQSQKQKRKHKKARAEAEAERLERAKRRDRRLGLEALEDRRDQEREQLGVELMMLHAERKKLAQIRAKLKRKRAKLEVPEKEVSSDSDSEGDSMRVLGLRRCPEDFEYAIECARPSGRRIIVYLNSKGMKTHVPSLMADYLEKHILFTPIPSNPESTSLPKANTGTSNVEINAKSDGAFNTQTLRTSPCTVSTQVLNGKAGAMSNRLSK